VLPWEDRSEYDDLLQSLVAEHWPNGPTEQHLVEELAGLMWRKQRLTLAEASAHRAGLHRALEEKNPWGYDRVLVRAALAHLDGGEPTEDAAAAIRATPEDTEAELRDLARPTLGPATYTRSSAARPSAVTICAGPKASEMRG